MLSVLCVSLDDAVSLFNKFIVSGFLYGVLFLSLRDHAQ